MNSGNHRPSRRRVVITGLGVMAPNGIGVDAYRTALRAGTSGVGEISRFDPADLECRIAGEVKHFPEENGSSAPAARRVGRAAPLLRSAAEEALRDAGVCWRAFGLEEK